MAETDIAPATSKDARAIIRLVEEAGWAYTRSEVERLIAVQPDGMLLARTRGFRREVIGCVYASMWGPMGFVGLMLVKMEHRGRGLGRELMEAGLARVGQQDAAFVGLDAVGSAVGFYSRLGFRSHWTSLRYGLDTARFDLPEVPPGARTADDVDLARAIELDRLVCHVDREALIRRLHRDDDAQVIVVPGEEGMIAYGVLRRSKGCLRLGPLVSLPGEAAALAAKDVLTWAIHETYPRMLTMNVPDYNGTMVELLASTGAIPYAPCLRMFLGEPGPAGRPEGVWALGAAEKG